MESPGFSKAWPAKAEYLTDAMQVVRAKNARMYFKVEAYPGIIFELAPGEKPVRHSNDLPEQVRLF